MRKTVFGLAVMMDDIAYWLLHPISSIGGL